MPTDYSYRFTVILAVVLGSLLAVFWGPPARFFDPHLSLIQKTNLRPGIDMVGGVSLVYSIQQPPGKPIPNLSEKVMEVLKQRIDPNGLRNLVWRPQGNDRLEIELPESPQSAEAPEIKAAFDDAAKQLDATNVLPISVTAVIEKYNGAERQSRLADLAGDSAARKQLFGQLSKLWDDITTLKANRANLPPVQLAVKLAPLQDQYDSLVGQIDSTNLLPDTFRSVLDQVNSSDAEQKKAGEKSLADLRSASADFPSRLKAIDNFVANYAKYLTVKDAITGSDDLKRLLQGSGVLEFHILATPVTANPTDLRAMMARMQPGGRGPLPQPGDSIRWYEVDRVEEFDHPGAPPQTTEWNGKHYVPVLVTREASMDKSSAISWGLENAHLTQSSDGSGNAVGFSFDAGGAKLFGDLTTYWFNLARNASNKACLAIVLDNRIISAPNLNSAITGGSGMISGGGAGGFTTAELDYLINTLNAGSLPAQLSSEPISEQKVGSTLGEDNLIRGLVACGFGLIVVAAFLVCYYYTAGLVAFVAVILNLIIVLGVMCLFDATFTLPAIAGIVLTIGTAVDANVLIFERLREEQHRGLPLRMALRNSYAQARSAIIDSNMTSIITSLCLYAFGTEEVKGFGLTLIIGIVASLFTALYVTKTIFGVMIDKFGVTNLSSFPLTFPAWDRLLKPNWDWMGKAWIFYTFSVIAITTGLVLFGIKLRDGQMMDIEFATGTSLQFELKHPMKQDEVRALIKAEADKDPKALPSPSVVSVGNEQTHYEIVTPNFDRAVVRNAVLDAMKGLLVLEVPSTFDQYDVTDFNTVKDTSILPIADASFQVDGYTPQDAAKHVGGVVIAMRHLNPPLTVKEIQARLDNLRSSASGGIEGMLEYTVEAPNDTGKPVAFATIVGWNSAVSYNADAAQWGDALANPLWKLTQSAINHPPAFEKETNFDPQVAGEMQKAAYLALFFSIVAIMIYIWVRFGNLKYGTATVVALLHDTVFTLAGLGFAHYFADFWPHNPLQIDPFRIGLTVVAGILTIMGYSMIDTIVVFDRIRENRGKYGHLNKQVINDAINQTLSRTLLTCGTTIITVSFMYFLGGEGIHGFTFVLLVGILVGTYSSVAIAAPLLLWGRETNVQPVGVVRATVEKLATTGAPRK